MRRLVYVGKNEKGEIFETPHYEEKREKERQGFKFTERLDNIPKEETEEQREKRLARIEKRLAKIREKA